MKLSDKGNLTTASIKFMTEELDRCLGGRKLTFDQQNPFFLRACLYLIDLRDDFSYQDGKEIIGLEDLVAEAVICAVHDVDVENRLHLQVVEENDYSKRFPDSETRVEPKPRPWSDGPISVPKRYQKIVTR